MANPLVLFGDGNGEVLLSLCLCSPGKIWTLEKKMKKNGNATTARIALWYSFSNVFVRGLAFLSTPIFARLLSQAEYGYFSNFTSWESILAIVVTLDFTASIARAKYDYDGKMDTYLSSILIVSNLVTLAVWAVIELNRDFFTSLFSMDMIYIRAMLLYIMFLPSFNYLQAKHRIYRKYRFFVAFAILSALIRTGISVMLVMTVQNKLLGRVAGYVIPTTALNVCLEIYILTKGRKLDVSMVRYASAISIPLIPHAISGIILGSSDRIMITRYIGAEANALYTLAYQVSLLANLLWMSMNQAWAPWLYDNIHDKQYSAIRRNSKIYLGVFSALIIGVLLVTPELMLILGGDGYYEARFVMPPVVMGCVFQFVYGMYVNLEIYTKKTFLISIGSVCAALLNIGLNALFIPRYGYIAAAYTTLVGYAALLVFHFVIVKTKVREYSRIYDERFISGMLAGLLLCCGAALFLYRHASLRYGLLLVYLAAMIVLVIRYKRTILKLLGLKKH